MTYEFACQKQGVSRALSIITLFPALGLGYLTRMLTGSSVLVLVIFLAVIIAEAVIVAAIESRFLKYTCTCTVGDKELVIETGKKTTTYRLSELTSVRTYPMENHHGTAEPRYWRMVIRAGEQKVTVDSVSMSLTASNGSRPADDFSKDAVTLRKACSLPEDED